ncbi:MAG: galactokinase [Spirochaetales bacterium]|nr:galactokinase [Spirochaetales bacterium]
MNNSGRSIDQRVEEFYGNQDSPPRFQRLVRDYHERFGSAQFSLFSSPGRTEIGGNHTDHNHGSVLAAAINLDSIAVASVNKSNSIVVYSDGYAKPFEVALRDLEPAAAERGSSTALIRGIAARFRQLGFAVGGVSACVSSDVLPGSGLSSSASFEVLIGTILNHLYNAGCVSPVDIAKIGQYAENKYFDKPCGLMDQIACACGGVVMIDFADPQNPVVEKMQLDLRGHGYELIIVDTGGSHEKLTGDYACVAAEMKEVAQLLGHGYAREVTLAELIANNKRIRKSAGDRAFLRMFHFLEENRRVREQTDALKQGDLQKFLSLVNESGDSSYKYLQNIYTQKNIAEQGLALALALSEKYIRETGGGACRVHGGGFAGTIQAFLPAAHVDGYTATVGDVFGRSSVKVIRLRDSGASMI